MDNNTLTRTIAGLLHVSEQQVNITETTKLTVSGRAYIKGQFEDFKFQLIPESQRGVGRGTSWQRTA